MSVSLDARQRPPITRSTTLAVVASACLAQIMIVLDTTIMAVALPSVQASLDLAASERQFVITAYTLAFGSMLLVGGRISQAIGIRRAFLLGLIGFAAASVLGGVATSAWVFLLARAIQGVFAALLAPTNLSMMNVAFPASKDRAKAFALFGAVAGAGAAIGLILGGVLTDQLSWRWCLWVNLPFAVVALLVARQTLGVLPGPRRRHGMGDVLGLVLGSAGVFGLVYGFSRAETDGWSDSVTVLALATAVILAISFLIRQHLARDPLLPLSIVTNRVRAASYLSIAGVGLAQMGSSVYLTYYFQEQLGYSPTRTGVLFLPMVLGLVVAAVLSTRLVVPRFGLRVAYPAGALVQALAFWMLSSIGPDSPYGDTLWLPLVIGGVGIGLVMAPAMSSATQGADARYSGLASAVANTSQQLGASLGIAFLATRAARAVTSGMENRVDDLKLRATAAMQQAGARPGSDKATEIVERLRLEALGQELVSAYGSGFLVMSAIAVALAVITAVLLVSVPRPAAVGADDATVGASDALMVEGANA